MNNIINLRKTELPLVITNQRCCPPIVDDPYIMGKIACANVLSNLCAMGITDCDNICMQFAAGSEMTEKERDVIIPLITAGFKGSANEAGTSVTDSESNNNWWIRNKCM